MKARGNFQFKKIGKKDLKKRPKPIIRIASKKSKNVFTMKRAENKVRILGYKI